MPNKGMNDHRLNLQRDASSGFRDIILRISNLFVYHTFRFSDHKSLISRIQTFIWLILLLSFFFCSVFLKTASFLSLLSGSDSLFQVFYSSNHNYKFRQFITEAP